MLIRLSIKNFALIDSLEIDFEEGLNILTGETGAGKSIIIDAIGLIVGERASYEYIRSGETTCEVEAVFNYKDPELDEVLGRYDIETEDGTIIMYRQLTDKGRSYCRINGRSVPVGALKNVGKHLVDIHGQHQHQSLLDQDNHIKLLDLLGGEELKEAKLDMVKTYEKFDGLTKKIRQLEDTAQQFGQDKKRLQYELEELERADLRSDEIAALEEQKETLANAERILASLDFGYSTLYQAYDTPSVTDSISRVIHQFEDIKDCFKPINKAIEYLSSVLYELDDLSTNLREYKEAIDFDMRTLNEIHGRLDLLKSLENKYNMSIEGLIEYKDQAALRLDEAVSFDAQIKGLRHDLEVVKEDLGGKALTLHRIRENVAKRLEEDISKELEDLGMKDISFAVNISWQEDPEGIGIQGRKVRVHREGTDHVEFLISTNPGEPLKPLIKIISGGETSRIMLALKSIMAKVDSIPCLIFDEVDAGLGGRAAQTVGQKLFGIARDHQTLCITHSPQIASQGDAHFLIKKEVSHGKTYTRVDRLGDEARISELARMLGGTEITENTLVHAKEMLTLARRS